MTRSPKVRRLLAAAVATVVLPVPAAFAADLTGTGGPDTLTGTAGDDRIDARGGDDTVVAGDGRDLVLGGFGADDLRGGLGPDDLRGGPDADLVDGGPGRDRILAVGADLARGGDDGDRLVARRGSSELHGDAGDDGLVYEVVEPGSPQLHGDEGDDYLFLNRENFSPPYGHASAFGGRGDDDIYSNDDGEARGGPGRDRIHAPHAASVDGGDDDDTLRIVSEPAVLTPVACGTGTDAVTGDVADVFPADCEDVTVEIYGPAEGGAVVDGSAYDDLAYVYGGGNTVRTYAGDDEVFLFANGSGNVVDVGSGDDFVHSVEFPARSDDLTCGPGEDTVRAGAGDVVADDCEDVTVYFYGSEEADEITGTLHRDLVDGGGGDDTIRTRGGDDEVSPGDGADTVDGGVGNDVILAYGDGTSDRITCGAGFDTVEGGDTRDVVAADCEVVG